MSSPNESPIVLVSIYSKNYPGGLLDLSHTIQSFEYEDLDTKADKCTLTVRNDDWSNFDTRVWHEGAILRLQWGYFNNLTPPRDMVVQGKAASKKQSKGKGGGGGKGNPAITGASELTIECHDLSVLMNKKKEVKTYRNKTRSDVANLIADAWGFPADKRFITATGVLKPTITQAAMTDAELLAAMAKAEGFKFYLDYDGFHWHERDFSQVPKRTWSWMRARNNSEAVIDVNIDNDATVMRPKVIVVKGIDKTTGKPFEVKASNVDTERTGLADSLEGSEDIAALMLTAEKLEQVSDVPEADDDNTIEMVDPRDKTTSLFIAAPPVMVVNDGSSQNAEEAKGKADAKYREMVACSVKLNLTVLGDPGFSAKEVFFFDCPSKRITGRYYAKKVVHKIGPGEYTMQIESITDGGNDGKGKRSAAKVNKENPPADGGRGDESSELKEIEVVDPRDKTTSIMYE